MAARKFFKVVQRSLCAKLLEKFLSYFCHRHTDIFFWFQGSWNVEIHPNTKVEKKICSTQKQHLPFNKVKLYIKFHIIIIFYLFILAQLNISACDGTSATDTLPLIVIIRFVQRWYLFIKKKNFHFILFTIKMLDTVGKREGLSVHIDKLRQFIYCMWCRYNSMTLFHSVIQTFQMVHLVLLDGLWG